MQLTDNQKAALRKVRAEAEARRQEKLAPKEKKVYIKPRPVKRYSEYLAAQKPITHHAAPVGARPKLSAKTSHRMQDLEKRFNSSGFFRPTKYGIPKGGYLVHVRKAQV